MDVIFLYPYLRLTKVYDRVDVPFLFISAVVASDIKEKWELYSVTVNDNFENKQ